MFRFYEENDIEKITEMSRRDSRSCRDIEGERKYIVKKEYCPPVVYVQCPSAIQHMMDRCATPVNRCEQRNVVNTCSCNVAEPCGCKTNTCSCGSCDPCGNVTNTNTCSSCDPCGNVTNTNTCNTCEPCSVINTNNVCEPVCVPCKKPVAATFVSKNLAAVSLLGNLATLPMNNILGGLTACAEGLVLDPISGTIRVCKDGLYQIDFSAKLTFAVGAGVSLVVNGEEILPIRAIFEVGELGGNVVLYLKAGDTVKLALTGLLSVDIKITGIAGVLTIIKID